MPDVYKRQSKDLLRYKEIGMIKVGSSEVEKIFCEYDAEKTAYKLMWSVDNGCLLYTSKLKGIHSQSNKRTKLLKGMNTSTF